MVKMLIRHALTSNWIFHFFISKEIFPYYTSIWALICLFLKKKFEEDGEDGFGKIEIFHLSKVISRGEGEGEEDYHAFIQIDIFWVCLGIFLRYTLDFYFSLTSWDIQRPLVYWCSDSILFLSLNLPFIIFIISLVLLALR